jgi:pyridoxal phosphate enzyme (YggS family)
MEYQALLANITKIAREAGRDPAEIKVIAVSKYHSVDEIQPLHAQGVRSFGESRLQEALPKMQQLPSDIEWHYIGSLQKNKAEKVLTHFSWIHAIDGLELAAKIASLIERGAPSRPLLLQVNASGEASKHGLSPDQWESCMDQLLHYQQLDIRGWMTMAPLTSDESIIKGTFAATRALRDRINQRFNLNWKELSMGMSGDYQLAIREGSTILRLGSAFFS